LPLRGACCVPVAFNVRAQVVFLAITPAGLRDALRSCGEQATPVWCGSDAVSEADHASLTGANVTRFTYPLLGQHVDVLAGAIDTIEQHHPDETVWVEKCA
jgi:hypothetical protein